MEEERISPEEKLLKAVQQGSQEKTSEKKEPSPGKRGALSASQAAEKVFGWRKKVSEFLLLKFHELKEKKLITTFYASFTGWRFNLRKVNNLLTGSAGLLVLFFLFDLFLIKPSVSFLEVRVAGPVALPELGLGQGPGKSLEDYTQLAETRNIFRPAAEQPSPSKVTNEKTVETVKGEMSGLKVVAIAATEKGFEAILENVDKKESFFVKKGDQFEGYEVETIDWKSVTVSRDHQTWELKW
jgi:hypothetical protein